MSENRFSNFTPQEKSVLYNGLMNERELDPEEDPSFPPIVETAEKLLLELMEE